MTLAPSFEVVMYWVYWTIFFAVYGVAWFSYLQWLAQRRIAALTDPSQFGIKPRILAFAGSISFAAAPPLAELVIRVQESKESSDLMFISFIFAWVISGLPGIVASRKTLRLGGINPDQEA
jgi:hypothetical protein